MPDNKSAMGNHEREEEPRLLAEILGVTLSLFKFMFAIGVPLAVIVFVLRNHPYVLMATIYALFIIVLIVIFGYQNYQWKKKEFERQRRSKQQDEQRAGQSGKGTSSGNGAR